MGTPSAWHYTTCVKSRFLAACYGPQRPISVSVQTTFDGGQRGCNLRRGDQPHEAEVLLELPGARGLGQPERHQPVAGGELHRDRRCSPVPQPRPARPPRSFPPRLPLDLRSRARQERYGGGLVPETRCGLLAWRVPGK